MTEDPTPSWIGRHAVRLIGVVSFFVLGFIVSDRVSIERALDSHETRITTLEHRPVASREDLLLVKEEIMSCLTNIRLDIPCK